MVCKVFSTDSLSSLESSELMRFCNSSTVLGSGGSLGTSSSRQVWPNCCHADMTVDKSNLLSILVMNSGLNSVSSYSTLETLSIINGYPFSTLARQEAMWLDHTIARLQESKDCHSPANGGFQIIVGY